MTMKMMEGMTGENDGMNDRENDGMNDRGKVME